MLSPQKLFLTAILSLLFSTAYSSSDTACCGKMGGSSYCDSSAGRVVCNNGFYSACYCDRHAVMNLQLLKGCCLWHGGVLPTYNRSGLVVCNDGAISEECSGKGQENSSLIY